jgi:replicative DNA helicase
MTTTVKEKMKTAIVAPEATDTEKYLLGVLMLDGDQFSSVLAEKLRPGDFFIIANQWVFQAMLDLYERGDTIDYMTVINEMRARDQLDKIGGEVTLTGFTVAVQGYNWYAAAYARTIRRYAEKRRLMDHNRLSVQAIVDDPEKLPFELWSAQMDKLQQLRPVSETDELLLGRDSTMFFVKALDDDLTNPVWFYFPLPRLTSAGASVYKPGDIVTVAGGEGSGKSAFVFQYAQHVAEVDKRRVLLVFTEMDKQNVLTRRKVRNNGKLSYTKLLTPEKMTKTELAEVYRTDEQLTGWVDRVDLWECGSINARDFVTGLREKVSRYHYDMIVIDGFNDLDFEPKRGQTIPSAIHNFMAYLETFARECGVLIMGTVQLNDEGKSLGSRAYERKSSLYLKIHTERTEHDESLTYDGMTYGTTPGEWSMYRAIEIRKNRRGPTGQRARFPFIGARFLWLDPSQTSTPRTGDAPGGA